MKHLKTFESYSAIAGRFPKVDETMDMFTMPVDSIRGDINENWASLQAGKLSKESLKKKFLDWAGSFGFDEKKSLAYGSRFAPSVYDYLYKDADAKTVKEDEFAKIHFTRCKTVKKEDGKWQDITSVGDSEGGPGGRKF